MTCVPCTLASLACSNYACNVVNVLVLNASLTDQGFPWNSRKTLF